MVTLYFNPQNSQVKNDCARDCPHRKQGSQPTESRPQYENGSHQFRNTRTDTSPRFEEVKPDSRTDFA